MDEEQRWFLAANLIAQARIYDALLALLSAESGSPQSAELIIELHRSNQFMYPIPEPIITDDDD